MSEIKGRQLTAGMTLQGGTEVLRLGRNGKRHLIAEVRRDGSEFTMRIDPRETYTVI